MQQYRGEGEVDKHMVDQIFWSLSFLFQCLQTVRLTATVFWAQNTLPTSLNFCTKYFLVRQTSSYLRSTGQHKNI